MSARCSLSVLLGSRTQIPVHGVFDSAATALESMDPTAAKLKTRPVRPIKATTTEMIDSQSMHRLSPSLPLFLFRISHGDLPSKLRGYCLVGGWEAVGPECSRCEARAMANNSTPSDPPTTENSYSGASLLYVSFTVFLFIAFMAAAYQRRRARALGNTAPTQDNALKTPPQFEVYVTHSEPPWSLGLIQPLALQNLSEDPASVEETPSLPPSSRSRRIIKRMISTESTASSNLVVPSLRPTATITGIAPLPYHDLRVAVLINMPTTEHMDGDSADMVIGVANFSV
ncbi:hypothetical protein HMN09_00873600 [Mycena chlorophos]|uniref:Uncharacterized protein n=1 Tax=Mycena chlorophos TaxID=658473 RepID=A0A8H6W1T9_MYCCL|nr:hypothetical protein HMN09_00873600 [Mycena chlorophos]